MIERVVRGTVRHLTPLLLGMSATAGLIGVVTWGLQAIGQLEKQRTQQHILETLLEESGTDHQPVHASADDLVFVRSRDHQTFPPLKIKPSRLFFADASPEFFFIVRPPSPLQRLHEKRN